MAFEEVGPFNRFYLEDTMVFDRVEEEDIADADGQDSVRFEAHIRVEYDASSLR